MNNDSRAGDRVNFIYIIEVKVRDGYYTTLHDKAFKTKQAEEVAEYIPGGENYSIYSYTLFSTPNFLHSDNGRSVVN